MKQKHFLLRLRFRAIRFVRQFFSPDLFFFFGVLLLFWFCRHISDFWAWDNCRLIPFSRIAGILCEYRFLRALAGAAALWLAVFSLSSLLLPRRANVIFLTVFTFVQGLLSLTEFYMVVWYSCPMKEMTAILRSTDQQEVREYFLSLFTHGSFLLPAALGLFLLILAAGLFFGFRRFQSPARRGLTAAAAGILPAVLMLLFQTPAESAVYEEAPCLQLIADLKRMDPFLKKVSVTVEQPKLPEGTEGVLAAQSPPVFGMVVIGESDNRHHHSLYGYGKNTDVFLEERTDRPVRFTDTLSATSSTIHSIFFMLTDARIRAKYEWPSFAVCEFFRKAGAEISFHEVQRAHGAWSSVAAVIFSSADRKKYYAGDGKNHYDGEILDPVAAETAEKTKKPKLLFAHLMGSHYEQRYRVPADWAGQHSGVLAGLDDYDRSIVYTGYILSRLLDSAMKKDTPAFLLYVPDHSEEPASRRSMTVPDPVYYEIPMFLWFNDAYRTAWPETVALAEAAAGKPFQTDLVLPLLMRLMNVPAGLLPAGDDLLAPDYCPGIRLIGWGEIPYPPDRDGKK